MDKQTQLTKTCFGCGQEKPLSAFLQISGTKGTSYGNICSTCRSASAPTVLPPMEEDERTGGTGLRIGSKEKLQIEIDKKREQERLKELEQKERKKSEKLFADKIDKKNAVEKAEKEHRTQYIDEKKKQSFLNYSTQKTPPSRQTIVVSQPPPLSNEQEFNLEFQKAEELSQRDITLNNISFLAPMLEDMNKLKYRSVIFLQFIALFANSHLAQFLKKSAFSSSNPVHSEKKVSEKQKPELEFTEKSWGPSSRKR